MRAMFVLVIGLGGCTTVLSAPDEPGDPTPGYQDPGGQSAPVQTAMQACADHAVAVCEKIAECSSSAQIRQAYGTMSSCVERQTLSCSSALGAPGTGWVPAQIAACTAAYGTYACDDFHASRPPDDCVIAGLLTNGAPCVFSSQCASTYCNNNKTAMCGTCDAPPLEGSSCLSANCGNGLQCNARTAQCLIAGSEGDTCDNNSAPCGADLYCLAGICVTTIVGVGMPCDRNRVGAAQTCVARVYGGDGAPCGTLSDGNYYACQGQCYTDSGVALAGEAGTCKSPAADGAPCNTLLGPGCLTPARCLLTGVGNHGICTIPVADACK
jgi:hypothetical protein